MLYIIFSRLDSDRYPFFSTKQEYFKEYLARKCPEDISSVRQSLEGILYRLKRMEEAGEKTGDGKEPQT